MKRLLLLTSLCAALPVFPLWGAENVYPLTAEMWARPRSGEAVAQMPPLRGAMVELARDANRRLEVRYPGGDEGALWAQELSAWLISLGLEPARINLQAGSAYGDMIELRVRTERVKP